MKNYKANTYVTATQVKKQNIVNTPERHHPPTAILVPLAKQDNCPKCREDLVSALSPGAVGGGA